MSAKVLTKAAAKEAKIDMIDGGRGTQAVNDVVVAMRAARRSGTANTKTKADVDLSGAKPWRQKGNGRASAGYASLLPRRLGGGSFNTSRQELPDGGVADFNAVPLAHQTHARSFLCHGGKRNWLRRVNRSRRHR